MGVMPVNQLLISMSLPMVMSMLVQALYNVVDSIFVSRINENALTAVSLAFPIQSLMIAVAAGTCVGINAVLSRSLGEKDYDKVNKSACNGIIIMALSYLLFLLIGIFGAGFFYRSQTQDAEIVQFGIDYLTVICSCSFGIFAQFTFEKLLQATGKTFYTMITQGAGALINIILDPVLIFGLGGLPKMGVKGAAVATVIGQVIAGLLAFYFNHKKNEEVKLRKKDMRLNGDIVKQIYVIGIPSMIMQAIGSVMTYGMNRILLTFSSTAAAVFGVYFKLQSFVFMPVFGMNNGLVPILAYNYGAGKKDRLCSHHHAAWTGCLKYHPGHAVKAVRRFRSDDRHRCTCPSHHQHQLSFCRLRHHMQHRISSAWKCRIQYDRIYCKTVSRTSSRCLPAVVNRQCKQCLVGFPDCGSGLFSRYRVFYVQDLSEYYQSYRRMIDRNVSK